MKGGGEAIVRCGGLISWVVDGWCRRRGRGFRRRPTARG